MACEHYIESLGPSACCFHECYVLPPSRRCIQEVLPNKKAYQLPDFLLGYSRGELPSHGRTDLVWGVDVDRLYFPLFVNGNHSVLFTS